MLRNEFLAKSYIVSEECVQTVCEIHLNKELHAFKYLFFWRLNVVICMLEEKMSYLSMNVYIIIVCVRVYVCRGASNSM
jgi:hypothetical protein